MLTKRTNILFDEELWKLLTYVAKTKKTSIGDVVRRAVFDTYADSMRMRKRYEACKKILEVRPEPFKGKIDYKELINYGRKY